MNGHLSLPLTSNPQPGGPRQDIIPSPQTAAKQNRGPYRCKHCFDLVFAHSFLFSSVLSNNRDPRSTTGTYKPPWLQINTDKKRKSAALPVHLSSYSLVTLPYICRSTHPLPCESCDSCDSDHHIQLVPPPLTAPLVALLAAISNSWSPAHISLTHASTSL